WSPADVRGLDHGVLKVRGDNLDVFPIKRNELETVHNPAFVLSTEGKVGRRSRCARLESASLHPLFATSPSCPAKAGHPVIMVSRLKDRGQPSSDWFLRSNESSRPDSISSNAFPGGWRFRCRRRSRNIPNGQYNI